MTAETDANLQVVTRGAERLLAVANQSERDSGRVQTVIIRALATHGVEPSRTRIMAAVGGMTDEQWANFIKRATD